MSIQWTTNAHRDYAAAVSYLADRDVGAARRLVERVDSALEDLNEGRVEGPAFTLTSGEQVRGWLVSPFRIYYQRDGQTLVVLRLYDQRRAPIVDRA